MGISLKPAHLKRYKDIAWLLWKYGRSERIRDFETDDATAQAEGAALADDLESLGPTFIKLGQLLSTRADLLPPAYVEALTRLQDRVEPFSFADVESTIQTELGVRVSKAFSEIDAKPCAAASLGQVHRARMRDGRQVAVKVQRPNIREQIGSDLDALAEAAGLIDGHTELGKRYEFQKMLEEFRRSLLRELDYRQEAANLRKMRENLAGFERIVIPAPIEDYTSERVLAMDWVDGQKVTALTPLARLEFDGAPLAEELFRAYLKQILVDGFVHADPHPGNVFITADRRIALLDLGMATHVTPSLRESLLELLLAVGEGRAEEAASLAIKIGEKREDFDETTFRRQLAAVLVERQHTTVERIDAGSLVLEVARTSGACGIRVPPELAMLGKTLLNLDRVAIVLDPGFDPNAAVRRHASEILTQRLKQSVTPGALFSGLLDLKEFVQTVPRRINQILDRIANNDISVRVDAIDEQLLLSGLQKIANRITLGLLLGSLILGAAMLMSVPTDWRIFGYPALAILFFLGAAGGGLALMLQILFHDVPSKK